jgi:hypothetical protein
MKLLRRLLVEYPDSFDASAATEALGDIHLRRQEYAEAEVCYRKCLSYGERAIGTGYADLSLAETILASEANRDHEIEQLLAEVAARPFYFKIPLFRYHRAHARLAARRRRTDQARDHAKKALDAASVTESVFRYHPTVGLVPESEPSLIELRELAARE